MKKNYNGCIFEFEYKKRRQIILEYRKIPVISSPAYKPPRL